MKTNLKLIALLLALMPIMHGAAFAQAPIAGNKELKITRIETSQRCDTIKAEFKILEKGKKTFTPSLLKKPKGKFTVSENGYSKQWWPVVDTILDIRDNKQKSLSDNLSILMLFDRSTSISDALLEEQSNVLRRFIAELNGPRIYVSFMGGGTVTESEFVDSAKYYDLLMPEFYPSNRKGEKHLPRAILSKLQELSGEKQSQETYPDVISNPDFAESSGEKMLFVFTDGKVMDDANEYYGGINSYVICRSLLSDREDMIADGRTENIPVFCVYVGDSANLNVEVQAMLEAICKTGMENDERGRFYKTIAPDSLQTLMIGTLDSLSSDYRLILINPDGKLYDGSKISLSIGVNDENGEVLWSGCRDYTRGSIQNNVKVAYSDGNTIWHVILGLLIGLLVIGLSYVVMQYVIPFIRYKVFLKKYVKQFVPGQKDVVSQKCYFCKEPFEEGDWVVTKCEHVVHKECWDENRNRCPEYGVHKCKKGIHYYNQERKSDPQNATHYSRWILFGLVSGLLGWLGIDLLGRTSIFKGLISTMTELHPAYSLLSDSPSEWSEIVTAAIAKIQPMLIGGFFLGMLIVFALSWVLEFRRREKKVVILMVARSLVGGLAGFLAFLLGAIIVLALGKESTCWYIDWIPWLLFSLSVAIVLWYKTEIKLSSALLGGAISVIFSFVTMVGLKGEFISMFGYMLYAAGFGMSVAVVHFTSEKYFLRIDGSVKERDIAIYKWMSVTGGFNKVSIGSSVNCVLQMNWDSSEGIGDRVVELYLENDRPYCHVLDNGVSQQGRSIPMGTIFPMVHGTEFSIGKTRFTYIEKDK